MNQKPVQLIKQNEKLGRELVLDELFDLTLYRYLASIADADAKKLLYSLIPLEERHLAFWQKFFSLGFGHLDMGRQIKLAIVIIFCRMFKTPAINLTLEAIEIYGIRKYLKVWEGHQGEELGRAVESILRDELEHEDAIVSELIDKNISPERVRSIFLGFNDGLVEVLGVVSGFFAAFQNLSAILAAGFMVAIAGSISMAAGAYIAAHSEEEIRITEDGKRQFLQGFRTQTLFVSRALRDASAVGFSYFVGAVIPILPVVFGHKNIITSVVASGIMIVIVSSILAFLSGMEIRRRILMNMVIISIAVGISYGIGILTKQMFGMML